MFISVSTISVINGNMLKADNVHALWFTVVGFKKGKKASFAVKLIVVLSYFTLARCYKGKKLTPV